jgi:LPXTG-motif cell wall-anchored protein
MICSFGAFVPFVHLVPYALEHGVSQTTAVLLLGMIGIGSTGVFGRRRRTQSPH